MFKRKLIASAAAASQLLALAPAHAQAVAGATEYQRDANGNLNKVIDPKSRTTTLTVDNLGRTQSVTLPAAKSGDPQGVVSYGWDGQDRPTSVKDPKGGATSYYRFGLDDVVRKLPDTNVVGFWQNEAGQLAATQTGSGNQFAMAVTSFDALNRPTLLAHMAGTTSLSYDEYSTTPGAENYGKGHLTAIRDKVYTTSVYGANTTASVIRLRYDQLGRVTSRCQLWGANANTTSYSCAASDMLQYRWGPTSGANAGRLLGLTYPSGRKVDYQYNSGGQITAITTTDPGSSTAKSVISSATYVPLDVAASGFGLASFNFGDGSTAPVQSHSRSYDTFARITHFTLGKGVTGITSQQASFSAQYDAASRITSIDTATSTGVLQQAVYGYDDLDRLTSVTLPGASYSYSYDLNGNRLTQVQGASTTTYTYPSNNNKLASVQVGTAQGNGPVQSVATNAESGNITGDVAAPAGTLSYSYADHAAVQYGRAARSQGPAGQYLYWYNYWGQRVRKSGSSYTPSGSSTALNPAPYIGSLDTAYHYDLDGHLIAEVDAATQAVKREYIWLGEQPVAVIAGATPTAQVNANTTPPTNAPTLYYIHADHLNTPRLLSDAAGAKRWSWSPLTGEAFGSTAANEAPAGQAAAQQFNLPLRFAGQYLDKETGEFYNQWRIYNPATGRYTSSDPIGLAGGLNTFAYVDGNPLTGFDPQGLANGGWKPSPGMLDPPKPAGPGLVKICHRPVNLSFLPSGAGQYLPNHYWIKTPNTESGMGGNCPNPGQRCSDRPYSDTNMKDHSGESNQAGAQCQPAGDDVDWQCVENLAKPGRPTGSWSAWNNCQTVTVDIINACRRK